MRKYTRKDKIKGYLVETSRVVPHGDHQFIVEVTDPHGVKRTVDSRRMRTKTHARKEHFRIVRCLMHDKPIEYLGDVGVDPKAVLEDAIEELGEAPNAELIEEFAQVIEDHKEIGETPEVVVGDIEAIVETAEVSGSIDMRLVTEVSGIGDSTAEDIINIMLTSEWNRTTDYPDPLALDEVPFLQAVAAFIRDNPDCDITPRRKDAILALAATKP